MKTYRYWSSGRAAAAVFLGYVLISRAATVEFQPIKLQTGSGGSLEPVLLETATPRARDYVAYRAWRRPFQQKIWVVARVRDDDGVSVREAPAEAWDILIDGVSYRRVPGSGRLSVQPIHVGKDSAAIVFVVNRSPSLESDGLAESVERRLNNWINVFGGELQKDGSAHQFGLVVYGRGAWRTAAPLDGDIKRTAQLAVERLDQDRDPNSEAKADIFVPLTEAVRMLRAVTNSPRRAVVLLTDGEELAQVTGAQWKEFFEEKASEQPSDREIVYLAQPIGHISRNQEKVRADAIREFIESARRAGRSAILLGGSQSPSEGFLTAVRTLAAEHLLLLESNRPDYPPADASEHRLVVSVLVNNRAVSSRPVSFFTVSVGGMPAWQIWLLLGLLVVVLSFVAFGVAAVRLRAGSGSRTGGETDASPTT